jgi:hypothetical protein
VGKIFEFQAELGQHVFHRNALAAVCEELLAFLKSAAIFVGDWLIVDQDFQQVDNGGEFARVVQLPDQSVGLASSVASCVSATAIAFSSIGARPLFLAAALQRLKDLRFLRGDHRPEFIRTRAVYPVT